MCGRYKLVAPTGRVFEDFALTGPRLNLQPCYNIAPTQEAPIVRRMPTGRQISMIRWGLIPSWSPGPRNGAPIGSGHINARAETVAKKPTFRDAMRSRRCLVLADGFYEWRTEGGEKQPMLFEMKDSAPFAFAGLYETWDRADAPLESFTIICTDANELIAPIHDRMPVIMLQDAWEPWLDTENVGVGVARDLLKQYPAEAMTVRPVSRRLNKAGAEDDESLLTPQLPRQPSLF